MAIETRVKGLGAVRVVVEQLGADLEVQQVSLC